MVPTIVEGYYPRCRSSRTIALRCLPSRRPSPKAYLTAARRTGRVCPVNDLLIGYARVSTLDQNLALQRDALKAAGCRRIFADEGVSGSVSARRGLEAALTALSPADTLVVWKLDRLNRSLSHLVTLIAELGARGVNFRSLSDPIDTASSGGRLVITSWALWPSSSAA
jgi:hypothetical protein